MSFGISITPSCHSELLARAYYKWALDSSTEFASQNAHSAYNTDMKHNGGGDAVYGLGLVGAAVFYIKTASSFGAGVIGVLKAIVWPAFMVYELLKYLQM